MTREYIKNYSENIMLSRMMCYCIEVMFLYVTFNGTKSIVQIVTCGVPQGSVLGPLLFLIYMNDLPLCLKASKAILFADDTTLYASSDDIAHLYKTVNHDLENLTDWFRANKLSLNTNKTHYMLFSHNRQLYPPDQYTIQIESNIIDRKNCCKFLGLLIDDKLTWSEHIAYVHSKLSKSLYAMNRSKYLIPSQYLKTLYDSFGTIVPFLWDNPLGWCIYIIFEKNTHKPEESSAIYAQK